MWQLEDGKIAWRPLFFVGSEKAGASGARRYVLLRQFASPCRLCRPRQLLREGPLLESFVEPPDFRGLTPQSRPPAVSARPFPSSAAFCKYHDIVRKPGGKAEADQAAFHAYMNLWNVTPGLYRLIRILPLNLRKWPIWGGAGLVNSITYKGCQFKYPFDFKWLVWLDPDSPHLRPPLAARRLLPQSSWMIVSTSNSESFLIMAK